MQVKVYCKNLNNPAQPMDSTYSFIIGADSAEYSVPEMFGPNGGELEDDSTDIDIIIPYEALSDTFAIRVATVTDVPPLPEGVEGMRLSWHFSPEGLQFADSITIAIPWTQEMLDSAGVDSPWDLELYYFSTGKGEWQLLTIVDVVDGKVSVKVDEFCYLSVRRDPAMSWVADLSSMMPTQYAMHPAYPNPFNPETHVAFDLPKSGDVKMSVYDIRGRAGAGCCLMTPLSAGRYVEVWDGRDESGLTVASGIYFIRIEAGDYARTRRSC